MRTIQTAFDVIELSPEAKKWKQTIREMYSIYSFIVARNGGRPRDHDVFEKELAVAIEKSRKEWKPTYHFYCFKLNGTGTGIAIRMNLRWFVKRFAR